ncbi:tetratricopeptide repeat protein [Fibrobacter sp.]|uniref:tetratricopeptide repeat protein n=1 Tax=Fibrobacter sp. TaxID=35828 RepID=UPI00260EFE61|nr:tetratricopeptide repeat protein [Fibrobacter sp.]MDD5943641.1 tetratricopeptide repeat protein [Fibrobacter sp.]
MNIRISAIALACLVGLSFSADPRMEQGARFEAKGDFEMALGEYRAVLAENPKSAEAYFAAAQVRMKMKDYSGALANYRLAYKFEPTMSAAYEGAAKVYEVLGQKAKADAERAKDPKNNPVAAEPVQEAAAPAETPAATEAPKADAPKAETAPAAPVAEAPKTVTAPEPKPVEKTAEVAKPEPAKVAETKATEPVKEESAALPTDPFEKGKALFAEGKYKEAPPLWREVLRKQPGHAGAYFYAGLTRYELGEMDKAEFNLKKGLEYKEEGNDANFFLAKIAQKSNKSDQELKFLAAYMKKAAPNAKYRAAAEARIAEIKAEKESKNQSAAADSKVAEPAEAPKTVVPAPTQVAEAPVAEPKVADIADAPSSTPTLANANLLYSAGSIESALKMYKALLETDQQPEDRYFTMLQLGNAYRELRDFHSAVVRYREVVQQFPDSDWAAEAERALEDAVWLEKHASELPRRTR